MPMCANVDMYSGLVYTMLGIPEDVFTPSSPRPHCRLVCQPHRGGSHLPPDHAPGLPGRHHPRKLSPMEERAATCVWPMWNKQTAKKAAPNSFGRGGLSLFTAP